MMHSHTDYALPVSSVIATAATFVATAVAEPADDPAVM